MNIRGLIFDINGTLIDINTDEGSNEMYRVLSNFLSYQGIALGPDAIRSLYFRIMKEQRRASGEQYPEFDVVKIFEEIVAQHAGDFTLSLPYWKLNHLPVFLAEIYRAVSRYRLELYPGVTETLAQLRPRYRMLALTDAQSPWAVPELHAVGLSGYFSRTIVSGDLGFRKPDGRVFSLALYDLGLSVSEVLFVGNDMFRDVYGAQQLGIKSVFFRSNQGEQYREGVNPDYIIYNFSELLQAVDFFEKMD
jgi:putative hydrolase of the HAD superfamily